MSKIKVSNAIGYAEDVWVKVVAVLTEYEQKVEAVKKDPSRSDEWKVEQLASLRARYEGMLTGRRQEGLEAIAEARQEVDAYFQAVEQSRRPSDVEAWREAYYRARFVQEDAERASPADIVSAYRQAQSAEDGVGVFLWGRYGVWQLERLSDTSVYDAEEIPQDAIRASVALGDLKREIDGGAKAERDESHGRLSHIESRFKQPLLADERRELGAVFGVNPEYMTIHGTGENA